MLELDPIRIDILIVSVMLTKLNAKPITLEDHPILV
jgi:hypothetical protein